MVEALFTYFLLFSIGVSFFYNFVFHTFFGMGLQRSTFLVDAEGVVRKVWRTVDVRQHDADVIAALDALGSPAS